MFHSRRLNTKINNVHEKALRTVHSDYKATFHKLLGKDTSFSVHHRNIQTFGNKNIVSITASWAIASNYGGSFQN